MLPYINNLQYILVVVLIAKLIIKLDGKIGKIRILGTVVLALVSTFAMKITNNNNLIVLISLSAIALTLRILFDVKIKNIVFSAIAIYVSMSMLGQMIRDLIMAITSMCNVPMSKDWSEILTLIVLAMLTVVVSKILKTKHGLKDVAFQYHILLLLIIIMDSVCISFLGGFIAEQLNAERKWIIEFVYIFTILGVFVQLGLLIAMILSRDEHKEKEALNAKYLEEQVAHYDYLKNREQETRKFRHDMKNHMLVLRNLYDTGKIEQFEEYFNTISQRITDFGNQISVGNDIADAIINQYAQEAAEDGIKLNVEGHFPANCYIASVDICTIFSNLLSNAILLCSNGIAKQIRKDGANCYIASVDICTIFSNLLSNAIRAEKDANGNEVQLIIRNLDNEIFVEVRNDYITELKRTGERFISTKQDRANHGLGLQNVQECVEKNNGMMHITTNNQIFDLKLNLKNMEA